MPKPFFPPLNFPSSNVELSQMSVGKEGEKKMYELNS